MSEYAIVVRNLKIRYQSRNVSSLKRHMMGKRSQATSFEAVKGISFTVSRGEILGIIGKNGCGKSTTLRAIAGIYSPDDGLIETFGNNVALMAIGVGFQPELTGRENIYLSGMLLGITEKEMSDKMDEIIDFSELGEFIDQPVRTYSSGMHSKLAFSITAALEPDVMLLDEVLSVGDQHFKTKSLNRMKEMIEDKNRTVVIVSHSISTLSELCDRVMWMEDGKIRRIGDTKVVLDEYKQSMNQKDREG